MLRVEQLACRLPSALTQLFIASAAQCRKYAVQDSKQERRPFSKWHRGDIQLRIIERLQERVKRKEGALKKRLMRQRSTRFNWTFRRYG
jgi:hypothetical protein